MIQSIQFRTKSFLLEPDWRDSLWKPGAKDSSQRLYDLGFELGALQGQMDDAGLQRGELSSRDIESFMGSLKAHQAEMDAWYQEFLSSSPSPLYWVSDTAPSFLIEDGEPGIDTLPGPFTFPTMRYATVITTYWALRIAVAGTFRQLFHEIASSSTSPVPSPSTQQPSGSPRTQRPSHLEQQPAQNTSTFAQRETDPGSNTSLPLKNPEPTDPSVSRISLNATTPDNDPITLATNIVRTMPFCMSDEQGILGAQHSLFALRVALFILRLHPGMELRWCQSIYRTMDSRKGLRYATEIAKLDGGHGTRGNERSEGVTPARTPPPREDAGPYTVGQGK